MKISLLAGAALALFPALAWSQPDVNNAPKTENPPNREPRGRRNNVENMTPEQRQQWEAKRNETRTRQILTAAGFNEVALQNAVLAFAKEQENARAPLQLKLRGIAQALRTKVLPDAQLAGLLNEYRALSEEEETRREKALAALDKQIGYSTKPRLDALLLLAGITGDGAPNLGGGFGARGGGGQGGGGQGGRARGGGFGALNR